MDFHKQRLAFTNGDRWTCDTLISKHFNEKQEKGDGNERTTQSLKPSEHKTKGDGRCYASKYSFGG